MAFSDDEIALPIPVPSSSLDAPWTGADIATMRYERSSQCPGPRPVPSPFSSQRAMQFRPFPNVRIECLRTHRGLPLLPALTDDLLRTPTFPEFQEDLCKEERIPFKPVYAFVVGMGTLRPRIEIGEASRVRSRQSPEFPADGGLRSANEDGRFFLCLSEPHEDRQLRTLCRGKMCHTVGRE